MPRSLRPRGDGGASAVEYALIVAAVAAILVPVAVALTILLGEVLTANCQQTAEQNLSSTSAADC